MKALFYPKQVAELQLAQKTLEAEFDRLVSKRSRRIHDAILADAIWGGICAMRDKEQDYVDRAQRLGQLLYCHIHYVDAVPCDGVGVVQ